MATIEIRTTQNVTITYELANVRDRILAFVIDFILVIVLYYFLLFSVLAAMQNFNGIESLLPFLFYFFPIFLFVSYAFTFEVVLHGQTIGKRMTGLKVVRIDGKEPGLTDYLLRALFYLFDVILCMGVIGALLIGTTARHQRLGDLTAHTTVVRVRSRLPHHLRDLLQISSPENYEPQYPGVRQFSEQDMLLVKNTLTRYQTYRNAAHREALVQLANRLAAILELDAPPPNSEAFLKTLLRDYVVLTR